MPINDPKTSTIVHPQQKPAIQKAQRRTNLGLINRLAQQALIQPDRLSPQEIKTLQHTVGNQNVTRMLAQHNVQAKLTVGAANDAYEQEADRVAQQVMSAPKASNPSVQLQGEGEELQAKPLIATISRLVQRQEGLDEEELQFSRVQRQEDEDELQFSRVQRQEDEDELQFSRVQRQEDEDELQFSRVQRQEDEDELQFSRVQRQEDEDELQFSRVQRQEDEDELQFSRVQRQEDEDELQFSRIQRAEGSLADSFEVGGGVEQAIGSSKGSGSPLPESVRRQMEPGFGADFSGVRVHTDSQSAELNQTLGAQAFTHGQDIFLGEGKYSPGSQDGQQLLAHELTHTIQQGAVTQRTPKEQE